MLTELFNSYVCTTYVVFSHSNDKRISPSRYLVYTKKEKKNGKKTR